MNDYPDSSNQRSEGRERGETCSPAYTSGVSVAIVFTKETHERDSRKRFTKEIHENGRGENLSEGRGDARLDVHLGGGDVPKVKALPTLFTPSPNTKMKRLFGITLIFTLVFSAVAWSLLYDFETKKQLDDWNVIQGTWSIIDGELDGRGPQAGQPGVMIVLADHIWKKEWTDYTVEFQAKILENTEDAGVVFRWQKAEPNDRRYYLYRIDNWPRGFNQKQAEGWVAGQMQGQEKIDIDSDVWYKFKLEVNGSKFDCYLDDKLMFKLEDPKDTYPWGRIGFRMWNSHARYDNLDLRGPGIPGTAVSPGGNMTTTWGKMKVYYH